MRKLKQIQTVSCLLFAGVSIFGAPVDFNNYTIGKIASTGTFSTNLLDSAGSNSGFVLNGTGSYELSVESAGGGKNLQLISRTAPSTAWIASEKPLALDENWKISIEFSLSGSPSGPVLFGLYAAGSTDKKGAYAEKSLFSFGSSDNRGIATVVQAVIRPAGNFTFNFIDSGGVPRSPGDAPNVDLQGRTAYRIEFECDAKIIVATLRQADGKSLYQRRINISDAAGRAIRAVDFAAGDIINNGTLGWNISISGIEFTAN
ncbi:MAG: hypothetical protein WC959_00035 [Kiritimatiellales bacterium]